MTPASGRSREDGVGGTVTARQSEAGAGLAPVLAFPHRQLRVQRAHELPCLTGRHPDPADHLRRREHERLAGLVVLLGRRHGRHREIDDESVVVVPDLGKAGVHARFVLTRQIQRQARFGLIGVRCLGHGPTRLAAGAQIGANVIVTFPHDGPVGLTVVTGRPPSLHLEVGQGLGRNQRVRTGQGRPPIMAVRTVGSDERPAATTAFVVAAVVCGPRARRSARGR